MTSKLTGHAEIDRQHAILEELVSRYDHVCQVGTNVSCTECTAALRQSCAHSLAGLTQEVLFFLAGHSTYEERLMDLLPDVPECRVHIDGHKKAHADIAIRLNELAALIDKEEPRKIGARLQRIATDWLGDHTEQYDEALALHLDRLEPAEIAFDAELVSILDEYVFHNRPKGPGRNVLATGIPDRVAARLALLTPRQREVCNLVAQGLANKEIANRLGTTINTVKTHRAEIFRKMEVNSVLGLARALEALSRPA